MLSPLYLPDLNSNFPGKLFTQSRVTGGRNDTDADVKHHVVDDVADVSTCVDACCQDTRCHVAMLSNNTCHLVSCAQDSFCLPVSLPPDTSDNSSLVLVRAASGGAWSLSSQVKEIYKGESNAN